MSRITKSKGGTWPEQACNKQRSICTVLMVYLLFALFSPYAHADDWPLPSSIPAYLDRIRPILDSVEGILDEEGVPRYFIFLALAESGGDPLSVSPKGAVGLWQLMPSTARAYGLSPRERLDAEKSTRAAARYIRHLLDEFHGDLLWTVAAYNAGGGNLRRATGYHRGMDFSIVKHKRPAAYALARTVQRMEAEYGQRTVTDNQDRGKDNPGNFGGNGYQGSDAKSADAPRMHD